MKLFSLLIAAAALLSAADIVDSATGSSFPATVSFDVQGTKTELSATGVATRKKFIVNVYSVALYLQDAESFKGKGFSDILSSKNAKQISMKWVRDVDLAKIQDGYRESIKNALGTSYDSLKAQADKFLALYTSGAKKGDEHALRFFPDGSIELIINGASQGKVEGSPLTTGVLSIWLGDKSVVKRESLISLIK